MTSASDSGSLLEAEGLAATGGGCSGDVRDQPKAKLHGAEVLELTQFVQKQQWINEKIKFLSTLAPVDAASPDPPSPSLTSQTELDEWWKEHDRIEEEVDAYDMGDLSKLKTFAKNASKAHLSARDTDLIEITLTTLFAVDRLLHLLRNRRKALNLLQYRLKWEQQVAAAWQGHRSLLSDLPTFLAKSRWTRPPPASPNHSLSQSLSACDASNSSRRSSFDPSTPRPIRAEVLSLELARLKSSIHTLTTSTVPASATILDKLIDTSSTPLPDSFLDEQDRLEEDVKSLTEGLNSFLALMVKQWKASDDVSGRAGRAASSIEQLEKDVASALLSLPQRSTLEELEKRQRAAEQEVRRMKEQVQRSIPQPTHVAAEDQAEQNRLLVRSLEEDVRAVTSSLDAVGERIGRYRTSVEVMERSMAVQKQLAETAAAFELFVAEEAALEGRPDLSNVEFLNLHPPEAAFDSRSSTLVAAIAPHLDSAQQLLRDSSSVIVDLSKTITDASIRRGVKEATHHLRDAQAAVERRLCSSAEEKKALQAARTLARALEKSQEKVDVAASSMREASEEARWRRVAPAQPPPADTVTRLRGDLDRSLASALANSEALLATKHPLLHSHLLTQASILRSRFSHLLNLEATAGRLHQQAVAATSLLAEIGDVDERTSAIADDLLARVAAPGGAASDEERESLRQSALQSKIDLHTRLTELKDSAHTRIPFLTSAADSHLPSPPVLSDNGLLPPCLAALPPSTSPSSVPRLLTDLASQDEIVRSAVNETIAAASGRLDHLEHLFYLLGHRQEAFALDAALSSANRQLAEFEQELDTLRGEFEYKEHDSTEALKALSLALDRVSSRLPSSSAAIDHLSSTLDALIASPLSSDKLFTAHQSRQTTLEDLLARQASIVASLDDLRRSIRRVTVACQRTEEEERRRKEENATRLAQWTTRLQQVVSDLEASTKTAEDLRLNVEHRLSRINTECADREVRRALLLASTDLSTDPDIDSTKLAALREAMLEQQSTISSFDTALTSHQSVISTLDEELSWLPPSDLSTSTAHRLLDIFRSSLSSIQRSAVEADDLLQQSQADDDAWTSARDQVLEERQRRLAEQLEERRHHEEEESRRRAEQEEQETRRMREEEELAERAARQVVEEQQKSRTVPEVVSSAPLRTLNNLDLPLERRARAEDVFGKRPSVPPYHFDDSTQGETAEVTALRQQLDIIVVDIWLDPTAVLHLPSLTEVNDLRQDLATIESQLDAAASTENSVWMDLDPVKEELERKSQVLKRIASLAEFGIKLSEADTILSHLLNSIDASSSDPPPDDDDPFGPPPMPFVSVSDALLAASDSITAVRKDAIPLIDDSRVKAHVDRVEETYAELSDMVNDLMPDVPRRPSSTTSSSSSLRLPRFSLPTPSRSSSHNQPRPSSSLSSSRTSSRGPSAASSRASSSRDILSRQSTVSLHTPTRRASAALSPTPRRKTSSAVLPLSTPRPASTVPRVFSFSSTTKSTPRNDLTRSTSGIPRSSSRRASVAPPTQLAVSSSRRPSETPSRRESLASSTSTRRSSYASATLSRYSRASLDKSSTFSPSSQIKRPYKANPNRKVDVQVAQIVNDLDIHVPISAAEGAYQDESGMYWIGDRLYFCRILRSKTVMVRVGGGWIGLAAFIISHFGSASGVTISPRISPSTSLQSNDPQWINSSSLSASQSSASSLANFLSASASSTHLSASTLGSTPFGRRTFSGSSSKSSLRRSISGLPPPAESTSKLVATPKAPKTLPQWRP